MTAKLLAKTMNPKRMMASEMKRAAQSKNKVRTDSLLNSSSYFVVFVVVVKVARPLTLLKATPQSKD